jgi:hypothetical protein
MASQHHEQDVRARRFIPGAEAIERLGPSFSIGFALRAKA